MVDTDARATPVIRTHLLELDRRVVHLPLSAGDLAELRAVLGPFLEAGTPSPVRARPGRPPAALAELARTQGVSITAGALPRPLLEQWRSQVVRAAGLTSPALSPGDASERLAVEDGQVEHGRDLAQGGGVDVGRAEEPGVVLPR